MNNLEICLTRGQGIDRRAGLLAVDGGTRAVTAAEEHHLDEGESL